MGEAPKPSTMAQALQVVDITDGWTFKQTDTEEWMPVAQFPTNVHLDLMHNEKYTASKLRGMIHH